MSIIEVDATQHPDAASAVHCAVTIARVTSDLSGHEADTLGALMLALIEGGTAQFTVEVES